MKCAKLITSRLGLCINNCVWSLDTWTGPKISLWSALQISSSGGSTLRPLRIWGGDWMQQSASTVGDLKPTRKRQSCHELLIGNWNIISLTGKGLVEEAKDIPWMLLPFLLLSVVALTFVELDDGWKLCFIFQGSVTKVCPGWAGGTCKPSRMDSTKEECSCWVCSC